MGARCAASSRAPCARSSRSRRRAHCRGCSCRSSSTGRVTSPPSPATTSPARRAPRRSSIPPRGATRALGVLSFVGFVPADEPRLVLLVLLDEPKTEKWGSEAAAPVFSAIAGPVLRYLEVPPRDAAPIQIVTGPGADAAAAAPVRLVATDHLTEAELSAGLMPDVRGRTLRRALAILAPLGVRVELAGRGRVAQQTPMPGERVHEDAVARLTLLPGGPRAGDAR